MGLRAVLRHYLPATDGELNLLPALGVMAGVVLATWAIAKLSFDLYEARFLALKRFFPAASGAAV